MELSSKAFFFFTNETQSWQSSYPKGLKSSHFIHDFNKIKEYSKSLYCQKTGCLSPAINLVSNLTQAKQGGWVNNFIYMIFFFSKTFVHSPTFPSQWQTSLVTFVWSSWESEPSFTEYLLLPLNTGSCFSSRNKAEQQRQGRKEICPHLSASPHHPANKRSRSLGAFHWVPFHIPHKLKEC